MITLNLQGSCTTGARGTGLGDCVKQYGDLLGIDIYRKGWSLDTTTDTLPNEAGYKALIQSEQLYPLNDLYSFEQLTPDNEFATGSTGKMSEIRAGKPQYSITWDLGACFHKGLYDKRGQNRWDIAFKFETGVLFASNVEGSKLKAFDNGMFSVATFKVLQGTDPEMSTVTFQLPTAIEFNERQVFYTWDALGYDMNNVNGVINAHLEYQTTPVAGTTVSVKVLDDCNRSVSVLGLDDPSNWALGGTQISATTISGVAYNATTEAYDLTLDTPLVSTDTVQPKLVDGADDVAENSSGDLYKGQAPLATIA